MFAKHLHHLKTVHRELSYECNVAPVSGWLKVIVQEVEMGPVSINTSSTELVTRVFFIELIGDIYVSSILQLV